MKPFNLTAAVNGAPLVMRNGSKVSRVIHIPEANMETVKLIVVTPEGDVIPFCESGREFNDDKERITDLFMYEDKKKLDWSKMPYGTWVEVSETGEKWHHRRLHSVKCHESIINISTLHACGDVEQTHIWEQLRLIEQPEVTFWKGGECPVPEGVMVELHFRGGEEDTHEGITMAWERRGSVSDIIGYRILGLADGWDC